MFRCCEEDQLFEDFDGDIEGTQAEDDEDDDEDRSKQSLHSRPISYVILQLHSNLYHLHKQLFLWKIVDGPWVPTQYPTSMLKI